MNHPDHLELINDFADTVRRGPPTLFGDPRDYFKGGWAEIKTIGSSFKEVRYPTRHDKDAAWAKFQEACNDFKAQQKDFDTDRFKDSEKLRDALLAVAESARPGTNFIEELFHAAERAVGALVEAGILVISFGLIKPEEGDSQLDQLKKLSHNHKRAWEKFNEEKRRLQRDHHQEVYLRLKDVGAELDEAWTEFKRQGAENYEARRRKREEWRSKQEAFSEMLRGRLENQKAYLEKKESELSGLEDKLASARGDSFRERVEGWIEQCRDKISEVEKDIEELKNKIREVEDGLRNSR